MRTGNPKKRCCLDFIESETGQAGRLGGTDRQGEPPVVATANLKNDELS
jgi:hypothetical protein